MELRRLDAICGNQKNLICLHIFVSMMQFAVSRNTMKYQFFHNLSMGSFVCRKSLPLVHFFQGSSTQFGEGEAVWPNAGEGEYNNWYIDRINSRTGPWAGTRQTFPEALEVIIF